MTDAEKIIAAVRAAWPSLMAWSQDKHRWPYRLWFEVPDFGAVLLGVSDDGARIEVKAAEPGVRVKEMRPHG